MAQRLDSFAFSSQKKYKIGVDLMYSKPLPAHGIKQRLQIRKKYINQLHALYRKSEGCIPINENVRSCSPFPHSCICERFIYSQDQSAYLAGQIGRPILGYILVNRSRWLVSHNGKSHGQQVHAAGALLDKLEERLLVWNQDVLKILLCPLVRYLGKISRRMRMGLGS